MYIKLLLNESNVITLKEYFYICEDFGCSFSEEGSSKTSDITLLGISEKNKRKYLLDIETWNPNTNDIENFSLEIKKSLVDDSISSTSEYPQSLELEIFSRGFFIPLPYLSNYLDRLVFSKEIITDVNFVNTQSEYLNEENKLDVNALAQAIKESLKIVDDLGEFHYLPTVLFVFKDTISKGNLENNDYSQVLLFEIIDTAKDKKASELESNCEILKKYYPNEECVNYSTTLRTSVIEEILSYDIYHYDIAEVVKASTINDPNYVLSVREEMDSWKDYYSNKTLTIDREINLYIRSFLEYLYYSGLSCESSKYEETCEEIYKLYEYSKLSVSRTEGSLCSHISYLPLLAVVSGETSIANELEYVLEYFPFESECMSSKGRNGFCSLDLEERFSCMELLYDSLKYYKDDLDVEEKLKNLALDTISVYLEDYKNRVGIWGKEDINLLTIGRTAEDLYPIKYYSIKNNFVFYKILVDIFR